jgi:hypothetical protein
LLIKVKYKPFFDANRVLLGETSELLPMLHFVLLDCSKLVARYLSNCGYELYAKNDMRFVDGLFKVARSIFNYNPKITPAQFLHQGFAERKLIFVCDIITLCMTKHNELCKKNKSTVKRPSSDPFQPEGAPEAEPQAPAPTVTRRANGGGSSPVRAKKPALLARPVSPPPSRNNEPARAVFAQPTVFSSPGPHLRPLPGTPVAQYPTSQEMPPYFKQEDDDEYGSSHGFAAGGTDAGVANYQTLPGDPSDYYMEPDFYLQNHEAKLNPALPASYPPVAIAEVRLNASLKTCTKKFACCRTFRVRPWPRPWNKFNRA